jgi:hypothetical protein
MTLLFINDLLNRRPLADKQQFSHLPAIVDGVQFPLNGKIKGGSLVFGLREFLSKLSRGKDKPVVHAVM